MLQVSFLQPIGFAQDRDKIKACILEVAACDEFILKQRVAALEEQIAHFTGAAHTIAVSSATGALAVALSVLDIHPGEEIVTPAYGFPSPANAILHAGGKPRFVDVNAETGMIDPDQIAAVHSERVRGILPMHLGGQMADMPWIRAFADRKGIFVLEDSAVALGAKWAARPAGLWGDIGVYSFWSGKPCGGIGEAGMIVTNDPHLGPRCRMMRNHGQDGITRFRHHAIGFNHRMDEITASYLLHKLERLPDLLQRRAELAQRYDGGLRSLAPYIVLPPKPTYRPAVYTYTLQAERRDALREYLGARGIQTKVGYLPLATQPAYSSLGHRKGEFPGAEGVSARTLLLPFYPEMPNAHADYVIESIHAFFGRA